MITIFTIPKPFTDPHINIIQTKEIKNELEFNDDWEEEIKKDLQKNGFLNQARSALDYFVFRNKSFKNMPAFAVGRVCWDNWMIYESRRRQIHTIEVRDIITPIHQKHDTVAGINDSKNRAVNPEAQNNLKLAGGAKHIFNLDDTSHILDKDGLREKKTSWKQLEKYLPRRFLCCPDYEIAKKFKRIYFCHIRKVGGTSLNHSFLALCGDNKKIYSRLVNSKKHYIKCGNKIFAGWSKELIEEGKYFYAFSHIPVHKLNLPPQTFIIGIIRNPIERVLSHYKMLLHFKEKKINHECMKVEGGWLGDSFSDFLDRVPRKDLLNQLYMFSENFNIDEAIINIKKCSHVFFTENYNEGIKKLSGKLKLDLKPFNERRAQNYFKPKKEDLIKLEKLLEPEIIFYNQVKEIFN